MNVRRHGGDRSSTRYITTTAARRAMSTATAKLRTPVLIVGGGPVGLYASALLSGYGVPSLSTARSAAQRRTRART